MLNFYNYYGKIHPELIKRLKDIESKLDNSTGRNDNVLIIRPESSKNVPEAFSDVYPEGETVYYDQSKHEGNITLNSGVEVEITEDLLAHIVYDIDKIIFYFPEDFEGLVYDKRKIRRNVPACQFYHRSYDNYSSSYTDDTIVCTREGSVNTGERFVINKIEHAM